MRLDSRDEMHNVPYEMQPKNKAIIIQQNMNNELKSFNNDIVNNRALIGIGNGSNGMVVN